GSADWWVYYRRLDYTGDSMRQGKKQKQVQPTSKKIEESLSYTVEVRDKEGRVLQRISAPSRSYVEQWNQLINAHASRADKTIRNTSGVEVSVSPYINNFRVIEVPPGTLGEIRWGMRIGKGTTPVAITDYALEIPLVEGTGTDEFEHQVTIMTAPSVVGSTCSFTIRRSMKNSSGSTITSIKEIGCYIYTPSGYFLGFRDILPSAVNVPNGGSITVTYTIKVTV
ncbi:unnamed protein product, partial [marine sediment metagenome]